MQKIDKSILLEFKNKTKFDIIKYYNDLYLFLKVDYQNINDYYSGNTKKLNQESFKKLELLKLQTTDILSIFTNSKNFNNYKYWELLSEIESIQLTLQTIDNLSKWLRSSISKSNFNTSGELEFILNQNQTLENFNRDILNSTNEHNEWVDTAIRNDLEEEDYTSQGGNLLKVSFTRFGRIDIKCVVDNISGEKVLGIDLTQKIEFENNDLKILSYRDTFYQAVYILSQLKKNDNPFYPDQGINKNFIVGTNINMLAYPSIFRQMSETFSYDDTIKTFSINDIKLILDSVHIEFEVESKMSENKIFTIKLNN